MDIAANNNHTGESKGSRNPEVNEAPQVQFLQCPSCSNSFQSSPDNHNNNVVCSTCGCNFSFIEFTPPKPNMIDVTDSIGTDGNTAHCVNHVENTAEYTCDVCNENICSMCLTQIGKNFVCPGCIGKVEKPKLEEEGWGFSWGGTAAHLAFLSIFIPFLSAFTAAFSVQGLFALRRKGNAFGAKTLWFSIAFSIMMFALWIAGIKTFLRFIA